MKRFALILTAIILAVMTGAWQAGTAHAVLFDFDNAPLHAPLPLDVTAGGITAHLSATGQGYSIQEAGAMGFTPAGFSGYCVYPSSVFLADLLISYSQTLTDFSIMYAPEEYGCDDSARMRVTAYMDGMFVGTATTTAPNPGTWPTGVLSISVPGGFNSVVVHYDAPPPSGGDWGPIFMADNMNVTPAPPASVSSAGLRPVAALTAAPNPFAAETTIRFDLPRTVPVWAEVHDAQGRLVRALSSGETMSSGVLRWDGLDDQGRVAPNGIYLVQVRAEGRTASGRVLMVRG